MSEAVRSVVDSLDVKVKVSVPELLNPPSDTDAVIDEVGGSTTIGTFTLPGNAVEVVEKKPTEAIFAANAAVLGAKVGYTIS